jgi:hypothetical protein
MHHTCERSVQDVTVEEEEDVDKLKKELEILRKRIEEQERTRNSGEQLQSVPHEQHLDHSPPECRREHASERERERRNIRHRSQPIYPDRRDRSASPCEREEHRSGKMVEESARDRLYVSAGRQSPERRERHRSDENERLRSFGRPSWEREDQLSPERRRGKGRRRSRASTPVRVKSILSRVTHVSRIKDERGEHERDRRIERSERRSRSPHNVRNSKWCVPHPL